MPQRSASRPPGPRAVRRADRARVARQHAWAPRAGATNSCRRHRAATQNRAIVHAFGQAGRGEGDVEGDAKGCTCGAAAASSWCRGVVARRLWTSARAACRMPGLRKAVPGSLCEGVGHERATQTDCCEAVARQQQFANSDGRRRRSANLHRRNGCGCRGVRGGRREASRGARVDKIVRRRGLRHRGSKGRVSGGKGSPRPCAQAHDSAVRVCWTACGGRS